tara:strand:+ start:158 stop:349 length:192 start_codon:yes stop_codon:yes gene_type:complete
MYISLGLRAKLGDDMEYITQENAIFIWFLGFFTTSAFIWGREVGILNAIDYFAEKGFIDLDDE